MHHDKAWTMHNVQQWCQKWMQSCPIWMWIWALFWMMFKPCSWKWSKNNPITTHQYLIWGQQYNYAAKCAKCSSYHEGTLNPILPVEHGSAAMGSLVPKFVVSNWFNSGCNREGHCMSGQNARKWSGLDFWRSTIQCKCIVLNVDFGALGNGDAL